MSDAAAMHGVILAGGLGTRIRHVLPALPKPMAPAAGRPFLEWVARFLVRQGLRDLTISTGHRADQIAAHFDGVALPGVTIGCISEPEPLGTAGGFLHAAAERHADSWLVCNGDSLALTGLAPMQAAIQTADAALLAVEMEDCSRYGALSVDADGRLLSFAEKRPGRALMNAGVYLLRGDLLKRFPPQRPLSFEHHVFPALLGAGARIVAVPAQAPFLDIGTEETLVQADTFVRAHPEYFS
jgi:D-glycero-alpha-D-manno-heptose 1-phosphate guanylyltransferase